jgi:glycosyltransferase involved in cell wall biosynthesis
MYLGKCVIVSGTPGVRDLIDDGRTGIVIEPGNAHALRKAIVDMWNDRARARTIGERARQVVAKRNTHEQYMRVHLENLTKLYRDTFDYS